MSTALHVGAFDLDEHPRPSFGRLVAVEWRKLADTRGGRVMLLITGGIIVLAFALVLLVTALNDDVTVKFGAFSQIMLIPASILLPVLAISTVTSEWSQRTALTTFAQEPHRGRVLWAKFVAVVLLATATLGLALALGALGTVVAAPIGGYDYGSALWDDMTVRAFVWAVVSQYLYFFMAFGIAMLMLSTAGGISVFYVCGLMLPIMVYSALTSLFGWAQELVPWIDMQYAMGPLASDTTLWGATQEPDFKSWAQFATSVIIWVVLPLTLGAIRVQRSEVK